MTIDQRINGLDVTLYNAIESQSSHCDKEDWLGVQRIIRHKPGGYTYLEIGSHLGGSIQPHLLDPLCKQIVSVDARPLQCPDDREQKFVKYTGNSTKRMMENLNNLAPEHVDKVTCVEGSGRDLTPQIFTQPPTFCLIDGEHTHGAAFADFLSCMRVCAPDAVICFHDAQVIIPALRDALHHLNMQGRRFHARKMREYNFMIFLGNHIFAADQWLLNASSNGQAWLAED